MKKITTKQIVILGMLTAVQIVLSRFLSISAWNIKIGFSFIPVVVAAVYFGPIGGAVVGALGDFLGATLFPIGAYFPGFTLTAALTGIVFGIFLHKDHKNMKRILCAVIIDQFILSLCLNTLWISILYGSPYGPLFLTRIIQTLILTVVQVVVIRLLGSPISYGKTHLLAETSR
ncbi:MAG: folate family ECF transporter S component [Eubacterium sp.]|nr:folate family ECF transporter S component [Eubacterium sp.]